MTIGGVRQHFTQKERDNETGLDYFGARYFASKRTKTGVRPAIFAISSSRWSPGINFRPAEGITMKSKSRASILREYFAAEEG